MLSEERGRTLDRLSAGARLRRIDPFVDVPWEAGLDPADDRWVRTLFDPIKDTGFFQQLSPSLRSQYALARLGAFCAHGIALEAGLQYALLLRSRTRAITDPELRFIYHEIIEESLHSQMFQEMVICAQAAWPEMPLPPLQPIEQDLVMSNISRVAEMSETFPEQMLLTLLAIEDPIDVLQREYRTLPTEQRHPIVDAVYRLHIGDEARHLAFARDLFGATCKTLTRRSLNRLRYVAPAMVRDLTTLTVGTPPYLIDAFGIPRAVLESDEYRLALRRRAASATQRLRNLLASHDVIDARTASVWRWFEP